MILNLEANIAYASSLTRGGGLAFPCRNAPVVM